MKRLISISVLNGKEYLVNPDHIVSIHSNGSYAQILTDIIDEKGKPYDISTKMNLQQLRDIIDGAYE